jgi:hypothetical protein
VKPDTYLKGTLAKIADGYPINKLDELMPWHMIPPSPGQTCVEASIPITPSR